MRLILIAFFTFLTQFTISSKYKIDIVENNLIKGQSDYRDYRIIRLQNGIEMIIVHDPFTPASAISANMGIGFQSDPKNFQGMAHFCEHLLFLGTSKYPVENGHINFLLKHSAQFNAYTSVDHTNYFLQIDNSFFEEAIDRLSHFFIDPLFREDSIRRESNSIDAEHKLHILDDNWRLFHMTMMSSNPNHTFHTFSVGNRNTLITTPRRNGLEFKDTIHTFFETNYSPKILKVAIYGNESLDVLQDWGVSAFSKIPNRPPPRPYQGDPLEGQYNTRYYVKSLDSRSVLQLKFSIPSQKPFYNSQPVVYLQHLLTFEGPHSTTSYLREKGLVTSIGLDYVEVTEDTDHLIIILNLSGPTRGYKIEDYNNIVLEFFACLKYYKDLGPQKEIYDDLKVVHDINFNTMEGVQPLSYCQSLSRSLHNPYIPRNLLLREGYLNNYNATEIQLLFDALVPEKFQFFLHSHAPGQYSDKDPYYGIDYFTMKYNSTFIEKLKHVPAAVGLKLPFKNPYIPKQLKITMEKITEPITHLDRIRHTSLISLWYRHASLFYVPRGVVNILLYSPFSSHSSINLVNTIILAKYLYLTETVNSYYFSMAGFSSTVMPSSRGLIIQLYSFSDYIIPLFYNIYKIIQNIDIYPFTFFALKAYVSNLQSAELKRSPLSSALFHLERSIVPHFREPQELIYELSKLTFSNFLAFIYEFFTNMKIDILVTGNIPEEDALHIANILETFNARPPTPSELVNLRSVSLNKGDHFYRSFNVSSPLEPSSSNLYYIEVGDSYNLSQYAAYSVLIEMIRFPVHDVLRTKEQLGYSVYLQSIKLGSTLGFYIALQGQRKPHILEYRIEALLESFLNYLHSMPKEDFHSYVKACLYKYKIKPTGMLEESNVLWDKIIDGDYIFSTSKQHYDAIKKVTKNDVINLYETAIYNKTNRSKLSFHVSSFADDFYNLFDIPYHHLSEYLSTKSITVPVSEILKLVNISHTVEFFFEQLTKHIIKTHNIEQAQVKAYISDAYKTLQSEFLEEKQKMMDTYGDFIENLSLFKAKSSLSRTFPRDPS